MQKQCARGWQLSESFCRSTVCERLDMVGKGQVREIGEKNMLILHGADQVYDLFDSVTVNWVCVCVCEFLLTPGQGQGQIKASRGPRPKILCAAPLHIQHDKMGSWMRAVHHPQKIFVFLIST